MITYTDQYPANAIVTADLDDRPPTGLWEDLATSDEFTRALIKSIRSHARGMYTDEFRQEMWELGLPPAFDEFAVGIAQGRQLSRIVFSIAIEKLGTGWSTLGDIRSVAGLLGLGDDDESDGPTIAIRLTPAFFDRRSGHRVEALELVTTLAASCDVRLISSGLWKRELAKKHPADLPGVREACNTTPTGLPLDQTVEAARGEFNPDGREVRVLRELAKTPTRILSYHELNSVLPFESHARYYVASLFKLNLVDKFDTADGKHVELLETGSAFLSDLDADIGRQAELNDCVSDSGKSSKYSRECPERDGGGEGPHADRRQHGTVVTPRFMPRWRHDAVVAAATDGAIAFVDHPERVSDECRQPYLSYEDDQLVVGAEYMNPMQWWVCIARALTDRRVFDNILTPERLDGELGSLSGLLTDDTRLLRDARCLGWLKDRDANAENYAVALMTAEDELCTLLTRLSNDDYECSTREFRGLITQHALGLAGTVAHLCDLAGVDLSRELRLGEFNRRFDAERSEDLSETIANGARISSRHGHFAAYRQLFEDREDKRAAAMEPTIPADDPTGEMVGSFVIVGKGASEYSDELGDRLGTGDEPHEDAPEFDVRIPFETGQGRSAFAQAARSALARKNLDAARVSVALFHGIAGSVYDITSGIAHSLESETMPREIRLDEVRRVLAHLPDDRLLPTMQPSVRSITKALLTVESPLTKSELADRADVSTRSVRTHLPRLEALGLADVSGAGIRFTLPFATSEERGKDIVPGLATQTGPDPVDALYDLAAAISGEAAHDPETPVGAAFFEADWATALSELPVYDRWIDLAGRLSHRGTDPETTTVRFGKRTQQAALTEATA